MAKEAPKIIVAPSILSADFGRLAEEIREVEQGGCDWIHVDVMDGHFVPNLTIGPLVIRHIRKATRLPLDVHLMIEEPLRYIEEFRKAGADLITVHVEATDKVGETIENVKGRGAKAGISLRPKTPVRQIEPYLEGLDLVLVMSVEPGFGGQSFIEETMDKVKSLKANSKFSGLLSVDGGINEETSRIAVEAGADVLVAGTAIFGAKDRAMAIGQLRRVGKS